MIMNVPLKLGLKNEELIDIVNNFILENYLNDQGNYKPVINVELDAVKNTAIVELSSIEEANKLAKVDSVKILGHSCKIRRLQESKFGDSSTLGKRLVDSVQDAQAQAAAIAALNMVQNKDQGVNYNVSKIDLF